MIVVTARLKKGSREQVDLTRNATHDAELELDSVVVCDGPEVVMLWGLHE